MCRDGYAQQFVQPDIHAAASRQRGRWLTQALSARFHLPPQAAPGRDQPLIFSNVNALPQTEAAKNPRCAHRSGIGV